MSTIYLAHSISKSWETWKDWDWKNLPVSILVSFYYLEDYNTKESKINIDPKYLMLDSGAYSAWNAGKSIDINLLTQESKNPRYSESVSLDVIGDHERSLQNAREMQSKGSRAYPVFHINEPWELLQTYCREFPKVGLSCRFGESIKESMYWISQCFNLCYPHPFHSFGWVGESLLKKFPFHSADSTGWMAPHRFGSWNKSLGGASVKDSWNYSLQCEVEKYLKMERFLQARWKKELSRWPVIIK